MAVEIPVYIDIKKTFDDAAKQVPKEMPTLEKAIGKNVLSIPVYFRGSGNFRTVGDALTSTNVSAKELRQIMKDLKHEFDNLSQKEAGTKRTSAAVKNLAKAYAAVEQRLTGFYNTNTVAAMAAENTINKIKFKIKELQNVLATQRAGTDAYDKTNYALRVQQQRLAEVTAQQMRYKAGIDTTTESMTKQTSVLNRLTQQFGAYISVYSLVRFVKQVRDVTGEFEYQRVALGHLIQDVDYGNELFGKLVEAAKESPFRIKDLVTYTKQLAAYRIEQENLFETTMRLADISAGLGVDMNRLILAYGQVRAASVLRGQELRQFTEAGIPLVELLADKFTKLNGEMVSTADVFKLISERAVPFEYIKEIFEDLTNAGGMFYKMQEEQAKTLKGRWEKLKDAYDQALMSVGNDETFQNWNDTVLKILTGIANNLRGVVRVVNAATISWVAYKVVTRVVASDGMKLARVFAKDYGAAGLLTVAVNGLSVAWKKFVTALSANWVGLALSALAGLITYFTTFKNKTKEATDTLTDMEKAIQNMKRANKDLEYGKGLISNYKELAENTNRTAKENENLKNTMNELKALYPQLAGEIGNENTELKDQVDLLERAADARHQLAVDEARAMLDTQKQIIRGLEDEKDAAELAYNAAERRKEIAEEAEKAGYTQRATAYGVEVVSNTKQLKQETIDAAKAAKEAKDEYEKIAKSLADAKKEAEDLEKVIDPKKKTKDWQQWAIEIDKLQDSMLKLGDTPVFDKKELGEFTSIYDLSKKLKKRIDDLTTSIAGMKSQFASMTDQTSDAAKALDKEIRASEKTLEIAEAIRLSLGLVFGKSKSSDTRLSDLRKDISEITNAYKKFLELRKYMGKEGALNEIGVLFPQLKGWEPTLENTLARIRGLMKDYKGPKDKVFLEMQRAVDTEISNLKFDELKRKTDAEFKRISDELKRSETARNFFENILGVTGDRELAESMTISVYGDIGTGFAERVHKQLEEAFETFDASDYNLWDQMRRAVENEDWNFILKNINGFGEKWRDELKKMNDDTKKQTDALVKNFADAWSKIDDNDVKSDIIRQMSAKKIQDLFDAASEMMNTPGVTSNEQEQIRKMLLKLIKMLKGQESLDLLKVSDEYIAFFSEINVMTTKQAATVRTELRKAYLKAFNDGAISADELHRNLRAIDTQFKKLTEDTGIWGSYLTGGFEKANQKLQEYADNVAVLAEKMKSGKPLSENEQAFATNMLRQFGSSSDQTKNIKSYQQLIEAFSSNGEGIESAGVAFSQMGEGMSSMASDGPGAIAIIDAIFKGVNGTITGIQELIDELNRLRSEENKIGEWFKYPTDWNKYIYEGWEKVKAGDVVGATMNLASAVASIFNNIQEDKVEKINDKIKDQSNLIDNLEYQYGRLENSIRKSFGSDYIANYNKQLEVLYAKQAAYEEQARLERSKGKSADEDVAKEFDKSAQQVADTIADMESQLSEFFSGTDLTSAAKDFATAWIDAYKEFGSTTDAMKEKFQDMVQEMVTNSLAARVMQNLLDPIFKQIDELSREGGELSAQDIATIAAAANAIIPNINDAMTTLMGTLNTAGYNIRQQAGQFTGIKRNIANATEESITGLAAGVNTQNFYMSYVPIISANVAAIVTYLTGDSTQTSGATPITPTNSELMMGHLDSLDRNLGAMLDLLRQVTTNRDGSFTNSKSLAIRMS